MILYRWRGPHRNFGDELNTLLWPRLLPGFFDDDETTRFLGIGSILDSRHDNPATKIVAGSGYGGYERRIALDETWIVHWVRGPRTARHLHLPPDLAIGDPASLVPLAGLMPPRESRDIGFMPHFESAVRGAWAEVAGIAGVTLIDPRADPVAIVAAIGKCRVLLSEALHGVIVADALRVPWIAIRPLAPIHRPKWLDWADTLELTLGFRRLCPSTALERAHLSRLSRFHVGRGMLHSQAAWLRGIARVRHIEQAARLLRAFTSVEPQLSRDALLDRAQSRMMDAIATLRRAPLRPGLSGASLRARRQSGQTLCQPTPADRVQSSSGIGGAASAESESAHTFRTKGPSGTTAPVAPMPRTTQATPLRRRADSDYHTALIRPTA